MRKTQYKLQKLYLVVTYEDKETQEWHMLMADELRETLSSNYKFYLDLAEKVRKDQQLSRSVWWQRWNGLWENKGDGANSSGVNNLLFVLCQFFTEKSTIVKSYF